MVALRLCSGLNATLSVGNNQTKKSQINRVDLGFLMALIDVYNVIKPLYLEIFRTRRKCLLLSSLEHHRSS